MNIIKSNFPRKLWHFRTPAGPRPRDSKFKGPQSFSQFGHFMRVFWYIGAPLTHFYEHFYPVKTKYHAPGHLPNANPREFTRFRPLRPSKYHAPGRLQNANPREFTRFRPLRPSKYQAPGRLQNTNAPEFTRFRPLRPSKYHAPERLQNATPPWIQEF